MKRSSTSDFFVIPGRMKSKRVLDELSGRYAIVFSHTRRVQLLYYDTVDWRLFLRGLVLAHNRGEYQLRRLDDDRQLHSCRGAAGLRFWRDFPEGPLRDCLRKTLGERAVLPVGQVGLRVRDMRVLNADKKTVVRARLEEGKTISDGSRAARVRMMSVHPVKGYEKEAGRLSRFLVSNGLSQTSKTRFETAVEASGRQIGDYSSKFEVRLDAAMTAQQAAATIFELLVDTIERNKAGVRDDIDTEVLHDFRVAIRRTRSGLSLMKGVLPADVADNYRARFTELGRATNRLRDLDVYLLHTDEYRAMVEESLRPALEPLLEQLASERAREHAALVRLLEDDVFQNLLESWRETLQAFGTPPLDAPRAGTAVGKFASRLISKRYREALTSGGRINDDSPDGLLHALRIECKKLRYLLEFFASLYPPNEIGALIKQLKRLQDNLGEFNDLSVQRAELRSFLKKDHRSLSVETGAAIGTLIANLAIRQREVRRQFKTTFASFVARKTGVRFEKLFG